jgi:hypothetical protein
MSTIAGRRVGKLRRRAGVTAGVLLLAVAALVPVSRSAPDVGHCSRPAADQILRELHLEAEPGELHPAAQVLCGVAFLGPGVEAMVASVKIPSCGRTGNWVVFRYDTKWRLVFQSHNGADLAAVGTDIKETQFVLRPGDAHCFPTGGTRSQVWHWNGTRFVGAGWKYSKPQAKKAKRSVFYSPSRNISCELADPHPLGARVHCQSVKRPHSVQMSAAGALRICRGVKCLGNPGEGTRVLGYGRSVTVGRFRCTSRQAGVTCVVTASGKGFLISRDAVRRVTSGGARSNAAFWTPLPGVIACGMNARGQYAGVMCQSLNPHGRPNDAAMATLKPDGRVTTCQGPSFSCQIGNPGEGTPHYGYGRVVTVGPFRCQILRSGVRCTLTANGKGFLFNEDGTTRVG